MAKIYYDDSCDIREIQNYTIAVLGYGSQGHAQAQNMRDSGLNVIIGLPLRSKSRSKAEEDGFEVFEPYEACEQAQIIQVLTPDQTQLQLYQESIAPNLKEGKALVFSHGFNIHFEVIQPPPFVDVYMVAPKGPGHLVRRVFVEGGGVPALMAIHQDATGRAKQRALAHAAAIGAGRAGILETTFRDETETDLFGEQAVLCGGLTSLIIKGFETLVEAGYDPDIAYFECLHEVKLIVDLIYEGGIANMRHSISDTAEYGDLTRGPRIVDDHVKQNMKSILEEIQKDKGAKFAKEWLNEAKNGYPNFYRLREEGQKHLIEETGKKLRAMMKFLKK
ncbi:MAG: ketol-acid reductoisomerase [Leptospiraceae bacterium]|nr:ketol-acid reductoisomerase [Leptospiraceae bacterium]MDW7977077.1 ketol-acid reductoisomerase [Leptospiraceae bacterium]